MSVESLKNISPFYQPRCMAEGRGRNGAEEGREAGGAREEMQQKSVFNSPPSPSPAFRKDDTPLNRKPGGLMEQSNASLQRGDQG
jgi:hypothetical protein